MSSILEKSIKKDYGDVMFDVTKLFESDGQIIPVTLSMDIALNGGWQEGTIGMIAGVSGSGKSTLCLVIAASAQKMGKTVYYIDAENRLQGSLLKTIEGLDVSPEKFKVIASTADKLLMGEDYLNILVNILTHEEDCVIILDSIAALGSETTFSAQIGESKQMLTGPKQMYEALRKACQLVRPRRHILIGITHVQSSPDMYNRNPEVGGKAWPYLSSYRITCLSSTEIPKDDPIKTGRESKFKVFKTALGPGTGEGVFYIKHKAGYDRVSDVFKQAEELGFIAKAGAWYSAKLLSGDQKIQGVTAFCDYLRQNPEDLNALEKEVRELVFGKATPVKAAKEKKKKDEQ